MSKEKNRLFFFFFVPLADDCKTTKKQKENVSINSQKRT